MSITSSLYDRRALDCSSDKPLINSLYHLSVLATTSARVRETLCLDGGLERLVAILKECQQDDSEPEDKITAKSKSPLIAWKWILALQCLVHLGTRGTETVRRRVVEAGIVPVITTVLDNYLQTMRFTDKKEKDKCPHGTCTSSLLPPSQHQQQVRLTPSANGVSFQQQQQQQQPSGGVGVASRHLGTTPNSSAGLRQQQQHAATAPPQQPAQYISLNSAGTNGSDTLSLSTFSTASESSIMSTASSSTVATAASQMDSLLSSLSNTGSSSAQPNNTDDATHPTQMSTSALGGSFASAMIQASAVAAATGSYSASPVTATGNANTQHPLSFNSVHLHSQASNAVYHAHARALVSQNAPSMPLNEAPTSAPSDDAAMRSVSPESTQTATQERPAVPEPQMADFSNSNAEWGAMRLTQANGPATQEDTVNTEETVSQLQLNTAVNNSSTVNQANAMVRSFQNNVIVPRDEDVIWSLEILAFVSKYAYLRQELQVSHFVPRLSLRDRNSPPLMRADLCETKDLDMMEVDGEEPPAPSLMQTTDWDYDCYDFESTCDIDPEFLGETVNVFPLVEKFTLKHLSRDIQYWAGVIMRNSCRKNESKGGIRQCANFECGKWEAFPRQFAKCRRCKRTKYCSKECQLSAWGFHRHWCLPSSGSSSSSSSSASTSSSTASAQTSSSGQSLAAARSATHPAQTIPTLGTATPSAGTGSGPGGNPIQVPRAVGRGTSVTTTMPAVDRS